MALVTDDHVLRVEMANEQVHTMSYEEEDTCMSYAEDMHVICSSFDLSAGRERGEANRERRKLLPRWGLRGGGRGGC